MGWDRPDRHRQRRLSGLLPGSGLEHGVGNRSACFPATMRLRPAGRRPRGQAARLVRVDEDGVTFTSHVDGSRQRLTPEVSIATQEALGADIMLAFDECTSPLRDAVHGCRRCSGRTAGRRAVWRRARARIRRCSASSRAASTGSSARRVPVSSASLPFDGAAIGGSLGKSKADMHAVLDWSVPQLPEAWPRHLLGIGEPEDLFACVARGVDQFDCVAPTRLGRHGQLYTPGGQAARHSARVRRRRARLSARAAAATRAARAFHAATCATCSPPTSCWRTRWRACTTFTSSST